MGVVARQGYKHVVINILSTVLGVINSVFINSSWKSMVSFMQL